MTWEPSHDEFSIRMLDGAVVVSGCSLSGVALSAPQVIRARCGAGEAQIALQDQVPEPACVHCSAGTARG